MKPLVKQMIRRFRASKARKLREVRAEARDSFSVLHALKMTTVQIRHQSRCDLLRPRLRQRDTSRVLSFRKWLGEPAEMLRYV